MKQLNIKEEVYLVDCPKSLSNDFFSTFVWEHEALPLEGKKYLCKEDPSWFFQNRGYDASQIVKRVELSAL